VGAGCDAKWCGKCDAGLAELAGRNQERNHCMRLQAPQHGTKESAV
jgi:hypothetical protein